jgi:aryl-alcohol dehydrogenase-like predicted oxidoreductase
VEHRTLGRTGLKVSPLCLGTAMLGPLGNTDERECIEVIHRALDAGINFVDTADQYLNEELLGRALAGRRDSVVLATKAFVPMDERDPNAQGTSRRWLTRAVDDSLRRLGTDWIDLYQMHRWDHAVGHEETLGVLTDLVRAGKIRYLGSSVYPAEEIVAAQWVAAQRKLERFVCEQPPYSILARGVEVGVLPVCERYGVGVATWAPLTGGWLSGRHRGGVAYESHRSSMTPGRYDPALPENAERVRAVERLAGLADQSGLTLIELALGFVLSHRAVTCPIIGPRTMEHLESQLSSLDVSLSADVLDRIDEIVPPGTTFNATVESGWQAPWLAEPSARRR